MKKAKDPIWQYSINNPDQCIIELVLSDEFKNNISQYTGHKSLNLIRHFIAENINYKLKTDSYSDLEIKYLDFNLWLLYYYKDYWSLTTPRYLLNGWHDFIYREVGIDEEDAIKEFYKVFELYLNDKSFNIDDVYKLTPKQAQELYEKNQ